MNINFSVLFNFFRGKTYFILCIFLTWLLFHFGLKVFGGLAVVYDIVLLARIVDKIDDELDGFWEWCICFGGLSISVTHICMIQYTALYGHIFYFSSIKDTYGVCVLMAVLFGIIGGGVYAADHDARYTKIPECWMNIKNRMRGIHEH